MPRHLGPGGGGGGGGGGNGGGGDPHACDTGGRVCNLP